jgi:hypothetical protein
MHGIWHETALAVTALARAALARPHVHLADSRRDGQLPPDTIRCAHCGALSSELSLDHSFTSDPGEVTCPSWLIYRYFAGWLGPDVGGTSFPPASGAGATRPGAWPDMQSVSPLPRLRGKVAGWAGWAWNPLASKMIHDHPYRSHPWTLGDHCGFIVGHPGGRCTTAGTCQHITCDQPRRYHTG